MLHADDLPAHRRGANTCRRRTEETYRRKQTIREGKAHFPTVCKETLANLAKGQHPYATILGCNDSRVPPELIFDADFGELFIIRVAGNVMSPEVEGSLQHAGSHLHTPLFVILGHEGCGAVQAALAYKYHRVEELSHIQVLVKDIVPGLPDTARECRKTKAWLRQSRRTCVGLCIN